MYPYDTKREKREETALCIQYTKTGFFFFLTQLRGLGTKPSGEGVDLE